MKKYITHLLVVALLACMGAVLAARPDNIRSEPASHAGNKVRIPSKAVEVSPGVFYLGESVADGKVVEGYAFIGRGSSAKKAKPDSVSCYSFLAKGAKWKGIEPYLVNAKNSVGLEESFILENFALDIAKWESAAGKEIIGSGNITTETLMVDLKSPDNENEVYFGDIAEDDVIAITVVWGTFGAPLPFRELVEWDQVYDQVDFDWSQSGEPGKMDFENIATHELGHSVGMNDLYTAKCSEQTMYGYAGYGETKKRTLETGDITGVRELYR